MSFVSPMPPFFHSETAPFCVLIALNLINCLPLIFLEALLYFEAPWYTQYLCHHCIWALPLLPVCPAVSWPISVCLALPQALGSQPSYGKDFRSRGIISFQSVVFLELLTSRSSSVNICWALTLSGRHRNWVLSYSSAWFPALSAFRFLVYPQNWAPAGSTADHVVLQTMTSPQILLSCVELACQSACYLLVLLTRSELVLLLLSF